MLPINNLTQEMIERVTDEMLVTAAKRTAKDMDGITIHTDKEALEYLLALVPGTKRSTIYEWNKNDDMLQDRILEALERVNSGG